MDAFIYKSEEPYFPDVVLDPDKGEFSFTGESFPENSYEFYKPIFNWFEEYFIRPLDETVIQFKFEYINSSSTRMITDLIAKFKEYFDAGDKIVVQWFYQEDEPEDMKLGTDISYVTDMPMEYEPMNFLAD